MGFRRARSVQQEQAKRRLKTSLVAHSTLASDVECLAGRTFPPLQLVAEENSSIEQHTSFGIYSTYLPLLMLGL